MDEVEFNQHFINGINDQIMAAMMGSSLSPPGVFTGMPNYISHSASHCITEFRDNDNVMERTDDLTWRVYNLTFTDLNKLNQNGIRYRFFTAPHTEKSCTTLYVQFETDADEIFAMILVS